MMVSEGVVFDVKRYAINDGPGIRVSVFLKGCNLRCDWCHNPEGISHGIEKMYTQSRCIGCGSCIVACPHGALRMTPQGVVTSMNPPCDSTIPACNDMTPPCPPLEGEGEGWPCTSACPSKAMEVSGKRMTVDGIMTIFEKERVFMEQSGGGVTFSGGEPMFQHEFLLQLLIEAGRRGFHRAVDTAGHVKRTVLLKIAQETDLFLYDLKMIDGQLHRKYTGVSNKRILDNLLVLSGTGREITIRIPLIGGVNDSEENAKASADFLLSLPGKIREVHLLPYHAIAQPKYSKLGRSRQFIRFNAPDDRNILFFQRCFGEAGFKVLTGG